MKTTPIHEDQNRSRQWPITSSKEQQRPHTFTLHSYGDERRENEFRPKILIISIVTGPSNSIETLYEASGDL
jgi:hypothetical protein